MPMVCGDAVIKIIQGDSYTRTIQVQGIDQEYIKNIYFTCQDLGVQKELVYNQDINKYELNFSSEETSQFKIASTNYDLTIYFNVDSVKTVIYKNTLKILPKNNKVVIDDE